MCKNQLRDYNNNFVSRGRKKKRVFCVGVRVKDKNKVDAQQTSGGIYEHNAICQNTLGSFVCTSKSYTNSIKYKLKGYWPIEVHSENYLLASTCVILQDASAPAHFERARSGDKDQGEPTV